MEVNGPVSRGGNRIPASVAAANWANQRREALDRAAVLRAQRRAQAEAQQVRLYFSRFGSSARFCDARVPYASTSKSVSRVSDGLCIMHVGFYFHFYFK